MEIYGPVKLRGSLVDGTGDELITKDASTDELGTAANALGTLASARIFVGNASSVPTGVAVSGDISIDNAGVTAIASGVIVNADVKSDAAIAVSKLAALTASRAIVSDGDGFLSVSSVTSTELGYVSGVTSAIQTQFSGKQATITGGATTITSSDLTANRALLSSGTGKVAVSSVTNTELGYLSGVTSALQTQLGTKLTATVTSAAEGDIIYFNGTNWINLARGTDGQTLRSSSTTILWDTPTINGIPVGGTDGQVLTKLSGTDFDADWETLVTASITDITATAAELNILDGATITVTELNFLDNASANIQTQLDNKLSTTLATNSVLVGVGGVATPSTDLPTGTTIGSAVIYRVGGSDVTLADGGTGASLADPGADRIMFWDDSAGAVTWLTVGTGLSISTTTINATVGITNAADANELMMSDGTNAVGSNVYMNGDSQLDLGNGSLAGSDRWITATGSASAVSLNIQAKNNISSALTLIAGETGKVTATSHSFAATSVVSPFKVRTRSTTGVTAGIGTGIALESATQDSNANYEIGATIEAVTTDVTAGSEDFDLVFKTMSAGAAAVERVRISGTGTLQVSQSTLGSGVIRYSSTATNDDPTVTIYQNRVTTTDATPTTLHTVTIPASTTVHLEARVVARRTGGVAGTTEDGASYIRIATYKNVAGTATIIGTITLSHAAEDQGGWNATFVVSGGDVLVQVTGAVDNNVTWHLAELKVMQVSS